MKKPKDRFHVSADELEHRMQTKKITHDKPLISVVDIIDYALGYVLKILGVDTTLGTNSIIQQQEALDIMITERPPEEMGKLSGFYIIKNMNPIAIVGDPYLANDGLAYLDIYWVQKEKMERFGGIKIIQ